MGELDCYDLLYFGFSLPHMWPLALRHLEEEYYLPLLGCWAGTPIISVGECTQVQGITPLYPAPLLTEADVKELSEGITVAEFHGYESETAEGEERMAPVSLFYLAHARYDRAPSWSRSGLTGLFSETDLHYYLTRLPARVGDLDRRQLQSLHAFRIYRDLPNYQLADFYPPDAAWVLRNLTAREIVRADALAQVTPNWQPPPYRDAAYGAFVKGRVTFGCVVFARTSWSTGTLEEQREGCYGCLDYERRRGVWAGHCFEITTVEKHKAQLQAMAAEERAAWRDVSEEVVHEMTRMWNYSGGRL